MNLKRILEYLFVSKVRIKALRYFLKNPDTPIHLRAVVRELNEEINAVRRELERLESIKMVNSQKKGNRKYFQLNQNFPYIEELSGLVFKGFGLGADLFAARNKLGDVKFIVMTQGITIGKSVGKHGIDLVIVGDKIDMTLLKSIIEKEEKKLERDIYYAVLPIDDYIVRTRRKDLFIQELLMQDLTFVLGRRVDFFEPLHKSTV